mmetsp:Transcript_3745/g.5095  ORF Transcript_3745/g.5095 Transcript_3745/m.5095 type:complete len:235 (+) Transcript_3745:601-1305(+)
MFKTTVKSVRMIVVVSWKMNKKKTMRTKMRMSKICKSTAMVTVNPSAGTTTAALTKHIISSVRKPMPMRTVSNTTPDPPVRTEISSLGSFTTRTAPLSQLSNTKMLAWATTLLGPSNPCVKIAPTDTATTSIKTLFTVRTVQLLPEAETTCRSARLICKRNLKPTTANARRTGILVVSSLVSSFSVLRFVPVATLITFVIATRRMPRMIRPNRWRLLKIYLLFLKKTRIRLHIS